MPLIKSGSESGFKDNVRTLMGEVGKSKHVQSPQQALAISYAIKRRANRASGGFNPARAPHVPKAPHVGPIISAVPGRTDKHEMDVPSASYVIPAHAVSHLGQSNTLAGMKVLNGMFGPGSKLDTAGQTMKRGPGPPALRPTNAPRDAGGRRGSHIGSPVPIMSAGGEFIVEPHIVMAIGDGNVKKGHAILDKWMTEIQKEHAKTIKNLPPPAKT